MPDPYISTLGNFEQPANVTPEKGPEQPFPTTSGSSGTKPREPLSLENTQDNEKAVNVVDQKTDEITTKEVIPEDSNTAFADEKEKEFITQIAELPDAKS